MGRSEGRTVVCRTKRAAVRDEIPVRVQSSRAHLRLAGGRSTAHLRDLRAMRQEQAGAPGLFPTVDERGGRRVSPFSERAAEPILAGIHAPIARAR